MGEHRFPGVDGCTGAEDVLVVKVGVVMTASVRALQVIPLFALPALMPRLTGVTAQVLGEVVTSSEGLLADATLERSTAAVDATMAGQAGL